MKKAAAGVLALAAVFIILTDIGAAADQKDVASGAKMTPVSQISYVESLDPVTNPYIGFYKATQINFKRNDDTIVKNPTDPLVHFRFDLSDFCKGKNGVQDYELDDKMLSALRKNLEGLRTRHQTAIVRFAYDESYAGRNADVQKDGKTLKRSVFEPETLSMVLRHQQQLGEVLSDYEDVIGSVECGMFGPWGEMHDSLNFGAENYEGSESAAEAFEKENYNAVIGKWLEVLPDDICVTVRQVKHFCNYAGIAQKDIGSYVAKKSDPAYRLGLFNDGYLGSDSDRGTFSKEYRKDVVAWLKTQARHTLYGGELVKLVEGSTISNTAAYMDTEAYDTHTSYLNIGWNGEAIDALRTEVYNGSDARYVGQSGFTFVQNRLGYRFVVRDVSVTKETDAAHGLTVEAEIENVGFSDLTKQESLVLILKGQNQTLYLDTEKLSEATGGAAVNNVPMLWENKTATTVRLQTPLPAALSLGEYAVYLRLIKDKDASGAEGCPIRFANEAKDGIPVYDELLGANYLCSFTLVDKLPEENPSGSDADGGEESGSGNGSGTPGKQTDISPEDGKGGKAPLPGSLIEAAAHFTGSAKKSAKAKRMTDDELYFRIVKKGKKGGADGTVAVCGLKDKKKKELTVPDLIRCKGVRYKVISIDQKVFQRNKRLTSVTLGRYLTSIGKRAFFKAKKLREVYIKSVTPVKTGKQAFGKKKQKRKIRFYYADKA